MDDYRGAAWRDRFLTQQFPLFASADASPHVTDLREAHADAARIAERLPTTVNFGTSSWSFPGWARLVYSEERSETALAREGLREYATHPLFSTVGVDRSYYGPVPEDDLRRYGEQLPPQFPCCFKAPAVVTSAIVPNGRRGAAPEANADFLSAERFSDELLEPCARSFYEHTGPFIVECPPVPKAFRVPPERFLERLDRFLGRLPDQFQYGVELRDADLLTPAYAATLARHGAGHVYNYWRAMPSLAAQAKIVPPEPLAFTVIRLLMPPRTSYESLRTSYRPFNRIVRPDEEMRADVTSLLARCVGARQTTYVLVNNKAEGSAPRTVRALAAALVGKH